MNFDEHLEIPSSWEEIDAASLQGVVLVLGATDVGKSTFARYLFRRLVEANPARPPAFLDGDPGQSSLGPPTTQTLTFQPSRRLDDQATPREGARRFFIGSTSPHGHMLATVVGVARLVEAAYQAGAGAIIYDTSGLIDPGAGGLALKGAKIELLHPGRVFAIQREDELEPLLIPWRRSDRAQVTTLRPPDAARCRDIAARQAHRRAQFARHFRGARPITFAWNHLAIFPTRRFTPQRLVAFEDREGFTLALGIVLGTERSTREVTVLTPLPSLKGVSAIDTGDILVDPDTFEDHRI